MNILIVEDDSVLNNGIALSLANHEILQAFSIKEAESKFNSDIELIILGINLPDGSGIYFCKNIRAYSGVPIIMLTANDMEIKLLEEEIGKFTNR